EGERRGDDCAGGGAGHQIEVVAQAECGIVLVPMAQFVLDPLEDAQGQDPTQASAVEREDSFRSRIPEMLVPGPFWICHATPSRSASEAGATCFTGRHVRIVPLTLASLSARACWLANVPAGLAGPANPSGFAGKMSRGCADVDAIRSKPFRVRL